MKAWELLLLAALGYGAYVLYERHKRTRDAENASFQKEKVLFAADPSAGIVTQLPDGRVQIAEYGAAGSRQSTEIVTQNANGTWQPPAPGFIGKNVIHTSPKSSPVAGDTGNVPTVSYNTATPTAPPPSAQAPLTTPSVLPKFEPDAVHSLVGQIARAKNSRTADT